MMELGRIVSETKTYQLGSEAVEALPPQKCATPIGQVVRQF